MIASARANFHKWVLQGKNYEACGKPVRRTIRVNGVKLSKGKVRTLVPVYEEGTVDDDLLNEGDKRIRDYFQRAGYFDARVTHTRTTEGSGSAARWWAGGSSAKSAPR